MNLDDFRIMQELYRGMINPEDEKEELYSAGGWPPGHNGQEDPGFAPQWMPLKSHLWNEMIEDLRADGVAWQHPRFKEVSGEWLKRWVAKVSTEWQSK